jgi:hypothetical protein
MQSEGPYSTLGRMNSAAKVILVAVMHTTLTTGSAEEPAVTLRKVEQRLRPVLASFRLNPHTFRPTPEDLPGKPLKNNENLAFRVHLRATHLPLPNVSSEAVGNCVARP